MRNAFIIILTLILLICCGSDNSFNEKTFNLNGGRGRNNSFEEITKFYDYSFYVDRIDNNLPGSSIAPLTLGDFGIAIALSNGTVVNVRDKQIFWKYKLDSGEYVMAGMCADENMNLYFISNNAKIYSLNNEGQLRWKYHWIIDLPKLIVFSDLLAIDSGLIAAASNGHISMFSFDGKELWKKSYEIAVSKTFAGTSSDKIIITLTNDDYLKDDIILCLDSKGNEIWLKKLLKTRIARPVAVLDNLIVLPVIESSENEKIPYIITYDTTGNRLWRAKLDFYPRNVSISRDGDVYVTGFNPGIAENYSGIKKFSKVGKKIWEQYFDIAIYSPLLLSQKIIAFSGAKTNATGVYFIDKDGTLINTVPISDAPPVNLIPTVTKDGIISFAGTSSLLLVRIDDTFLNKLLPW